MNAYEEGVLINTGFQSYGRAVKVNRAAITGLYTVLAVLIPVIVPVFLAPIIYKALPSHVRFLGRHSAIPM